jgi:hypothetical protein
MANGAHGGLPGDADLVSMVALEDKTVVAVGEDGTAAHRRCLRAAAMNGRTASARIDPND